MITFDDVSFAYQGGIPDGSEPPALRHIHFHAERGECIVLCGKADAGKRRCCAWSMALFLILSGTPGGRHYCWKRPYKGSIPSPGCRRGGQRVSESEDTVFHLDTTGEMAFNMENLNIPHDKMVERLKETAWKLDIQTLMDRDIFQLSGGESSKLHVVPCMPPCLRSSSWMNRPRIWTWKASESCKT